MTQPAIAARISIDPESANQVRPHQAVEELSLGLRAVKGSAVELVGPLFLPRQCAVRVSFQEPGQAWNPAVETGPLRDLAGEVRRVQLLDSTPVYALTVQLESTPPQILDRLRDGLEG